MKILITGGSGFVGTHLSHLLLSRGYQVTATGTRPKPETIRHENFSYIQSDTTQKSAWQDALKDVDGVVNLAGLSIFNYWTKGYKQRIYDSRVLTTRNLVESLPKDRPIVLCSTSAAGYYGNRGDDILTEDAPNGKDFLAQVCRDWEAEAFRGKERDARVVTMRFGVVLGKGGGAMKQMIPAFRFFLGGPLGSGMQWFPWIHMDDLLSAILFVLENTDISGPVNFSAPGSLRQRDFAKTLGRVMGRLAIMPAPAFMMRLILGEFGASLLSSQRTCPEKLLAHGFDFKYPDIENAMRDIV